MKRLFATTSYAAIIAYSNTVVIRSLIDGSPVTIDFAGYNPATHELHPDGEAPIAFDPNNGPTLEEWRERGYTGPYPPRGYAPRKSPANPEGTEQPAIAPKSQQPSEPAHTTTPTDDADEVDPIDNAECIAAYKGKVIAVIKEGGSFKVIDNTDPTAPKLVVWPDIVDAAGYKTNKAAWEVVSKIALKLA